MVAILVALVSVAFVAGCTLRLFRRSLTYTLYLILKLTGITRLHRRLTRYREQDAEGLPLLANKHRKRRKSSLRWSSSMADPQRSLNDHVRSPGLRNIYDEVAMRQYEMV